MEDTPNTQKDRTRYVEELEGPSDYWLSITDASRVCRVQDVSIRRAIASGRLPVRPQGAGDNKRTRFVRASDLPRANFPILDSGAAITSDIRKVDILDIPLQIKRLTQLLTQIQADQHLELNQIRIDLEAIQQTTQEQIKQIQTDLTTLHGQQVASTNRLMTIEGDQKALALHEQQEREAAQERWQAMLTEMEQRQTRRMEEIAGELRRIRTSLEEQAGRIKETVAQIQASLQEHMQQVEAHSQKQVQEAEERLQAQFQADLAAVCKEFEEHEAKKVEGLTRLVEQGRQQREQFERVMTNVAANADRTASEAKATVVSLVSQLNAERTARLALEERVKQYESQQDTAEMQALPSTKRSSRRKAAEPPA